MSRSLTLTGRAIAALVAAALVVTPAAASPPAGFSAQMDSNLAASGTPGMAVTIVEGGKIVLAQGYGVRKLGAPERVDADTIFPNGSTGKAFTTAALAILVDQGKIGWDDKVIDHLPWFQMYDPWVTREITVRDLLVHRSGLGLGAGDLLFVPRTSLSRRESVRRLRYIKPATSFRSGYAYDNVLYMVAGQLIEEVTGQTWEVFVREQVLKPAGMRASTTDDAHRFANPNRAHPHARLDGPMRGLGNQERLNEGEALGDNAAPAGGLAVSANDMGRWIQIQLAQGQLPEGSGRLFSADAAREMWTPQVNMPISERPAAIQTAAPQFSAYALGWEVRDYRGEKIVWHAGAVFGFRAVVVLIPGRNVGFSILTNAEDPIPLLATMYELLDHYMEKPDIDWRTALEGVLQQQVAAAVQVLNTSSAVPARIGPSLPLSRYAGAFADPWYGPIAITEAKGKLVLDFRQSPGMVGDLTHFQYDTFKVVWRDKSIEPAYVTFNLDADGAVERITMKAVSPLADFSYDYQDLEFRPVPAGPAPGGG